VLSSPLQKYRPHPTVSVAFHTSCVKWPVASLKPGESKSYWARSLPQASTEEVAFA
jgi:hypothetical protein